MFPVAKTMKDESLHLTVERAVDLDGLSVLREELRGAFGGTLPVVLRIAAPSGVPLLQLLCSAHRTAAAAGRALAVDWQYPKEVGALLEEAGFARHWPPGYPPVDPEALDLRSQDRRCEIRQWNRPDSTECG
jgi:hypothetical protein